MVQQTQAGESSLAVCARRPSGNGSGRGKGLRGTASAPSTLPLLSGDLCGACWRARLTVALQVLLQKGSEPLN